MTKKEIMEEIKSRYEKARSKWEKGVLEYATDLLDYIPDDVTPTETMLLNGARDWNQYSDSGCALVFDQDICERLCTPSEQERKDYGRLSPGIGESWIGTQTRALKQAAEFIKFYARI